MKVTEQQKMLYDYLYGKPPHNASHIDLLCNGLSEYSYLYEEVTYQQQTKDGKTENMKGLQLRPELILDYSVPYYVGIHITENDMKALNWSGKVTFAAPKTLLNLARSAATKFCRADGYCSKWWDSVEMKPTTSGDSVEDVRRKVLQSMWDYQCRKMPDAVSDNDVDEKILKKKILKRLPQRIINNLQHHLPKICCAL